MVRNDTRSITGKNVRMIALLAGRDKFSDVSKDDILRIPYFHMEDQDKWRVVLIDEIIRSKYDEIEVPGFDSEELSDILNYACKS